MWVRLLSILMVFTLLSAFVLPGCVDIDTEDDTAGWEENGSLDDSDWRTDDWE